MDQDKAESIINELIPFVKPKEVTDVAFDIRNTTPDDKFILHAVFYVDDEWWNSLDIINKAAFLHETKMKLRQGIQNYSGIKILFDKDNTRIAGKRN
jgi:hypothetical protein